MGYVLPEIKSQGWKALIKELGYAGATQFILMHESGKGNYTEERKELFRGKTVDEIAGEIKKLGVKNK